MTDLHDYNWAGHTGRRRREEILAFLGVRRIRRTIEMNSTPGSKETFARGIAFGDAVANIEASLTEPESATGFWRHEGDPGLSD